MPIQEGSHNPMNNPSAHWLLQLPLTSLEEARIGLLAILLVLAAVIDYRTLRIPNWLTLAGALAGLGLSAAVAIRPLDGLLWALAGAASGLAILLPLYAMRVLGAGDTKLMAMVGAFLGLPETIPALLCSFAMAGLAAVIYVAAHRSVPRLVANFRALLHSAVMAAATGQPFSGLPPGASVGKLPYGVSICAGTLCYLVAHQLGYL